jgi:hypothetical protein
MSLLKQIIEALPNICSSYFEATLIGSIFHNHYHALEVDAILYRLYATLII